MLKALPANLIFDDLERCTLDAEVLLGLINDFVEHQRKRVVLVANSAKVAKPDDFLARKEKVVGRTLRLIADANAVVPLIFESMPAGNAQNWMRENAGLMIAVFEQSNSHNLRILRQAIHDCGRVLDRFDDDLLAGKDGVARFAQTYVALAIALIGNEITRDDLAERGNIQFFRTKPDQAVPNLSVIADRHPALEIGCFVTSSILPVRLSMALLGDGFETRTRLNAHLLATGQFEAVDEDPLWKRMVLWRHQTHEELTHTVSEAEVYVFCQDAVDAGPFLQISDNLLQIMAVEGEDKERELSERLVFRVETLARTRSIAPLRPNGKKQWSVLKNTFRYGGYASEVNQFFHPVLVAVDAALRHDLLLSMPEHGAQLLDLFETDFVSFALRFAYQDAPESLMATPILHHCDPTRFATRLFAYILDRSEEALGDTIKHLGERQGMGGDWPLEHAWAANVKTALLAQADTQDRFARAVVQNFLGFHWRFKSPAGADET